MQKETLYKKVQIKREKYKKNVMYLFFNYVSLNEFRGRIYMQKLSRNVKGISLLTRIHFD